MSPNPRLADTQPLSRDDIAGIALSLAREIAALHRSDVVHGHIRPSRIRFANGTVELDPPDGDGLSKAHDVRSIGELTLWLLSRHGHTADGQVGDIARAAAALDPASRPTAEELRTRLEEAVDAPASEASARLTPRSPRPALKVVAALGISVCVAVMALVVIWNLRSHRREPVAPAKPALAPGRPVVSGDRLPAQEWPEALRACPDVVAELRADIDADGCDEVLTVRGSRLETGVGTVEIAGIELGHHVTGDWLCIGRATLAVLDVTTGAVFVFPKWARPGEDVHAMPAGPFPGATSLASSDKDGDGCDDLRAVTAIGEIAVEVGP